jgi:AraC-like DNA-binding protein
MSELAPYMYVLAMDSGLNLLITEGWDTRIGSVSLAGEVLDAEPYVTRPHRVVPDRWVLSVLIAGSGHYRFADGRRVALTAGSVLLVPPGHRHWYGTEDGAPWTELFAVFAGPLFDLLAGTGVLTDQVVHRPHPRPRTAALRALLSREPRSQHDAELQVMGLGQWLVDLLRPAAAEPRSAEMTAAVDLLEADPTASLSMPEVARSIGMTYDAFRRQFAREVGQSPLEYRNHRRLQTAAGLLLMTGMTTRAIARSLGYTDEFHLSRRFRAAYGIPPSEYRRRG